MGWLYMGVCAMDFVVFPILWSLLQASTHTMPITQWQPLTLQGAGLFHIAMGAVLGIAALGRTQEKLAGANNGGLQPIAQSTTTTFGPAPSSFGSTPAPSFSQPKPVSSGFGAPSSGFGQSTSSMPAVNKPVSTGPIDSDYMPPRD